jgi:membrane-associated phospholipid phosphatase
VSFELPFPKFAGVLIVSIATIDFVWLLTSNISLKVPPLTFLIVVTSVLFAGSTWIGRRRTSGGGSDAFIRRLGDFSGQMAFIFLCWPVLRVFNYLLMSTSLPYADSTLASWDRALNLDWQAYFTFVAEHPMLIRLLGLCYTSLSLLCFIVFCLLFLLKESVRIRYFLNTFIITAVICTIAGFLLPAEGAVVHYLGTSPDTRNFGETPGVYFLEQLSQIRSGLPIALDIRDLPGLVTFPSFHTAGALAVAASFRGLLLFWPAFFYAVLVIAATPVFGGHYFVDLISGSLIAICVAAGVGALPSYRFLFAKPGSLKIAGQPLPGKV